MNVLSLTYLGNVQYYTKLCLTECVIDIHENFLKQSYRNRCDILSANGVTPLTVNVVKQSNLNKLSVKETRIDYSKRWQHQHWQSLVSAYKNSPYFDFYVDQFEPLYTRRFDFLLDLNVGLMEVVMRLMGCNTAIKFSDSYINPQTNGIVDLRDVISPKPRLSQPDPHFTPIPYWQVFSDKLPFAPNLSIIDLLFCEGTNALSLLQSMHQGEVVRIGK